MSRYTFQNLIIDTLEKAKVPLSTTEIWEHAGKYGFNKKLMSTGKTPWHSIASKIYVDMKTNSDSTNFKMVGKNPRRFYLKDSTIQASEEELLNKTEEADELYEEKSKKATTFQEIDLHPLLVKFINESIYFKADSKTISDKKSRKSQKGKNRWLHPDIVGVYFSFNDFDSITTEVRKSLTSNSAKLFSFELKCKISFSNLREYYFQAVSNSSWANEGYLVTLDIQNEPELLDELKRLNNAFGIGLIKLNPEDTAQSEIIFSARERKELDWHTIDRLITTNPDFKQLFETISNSQQIGKKIDEFDKPLNDDELETHIKKKKIKAEN